MASVISASTTSTTALTLSGDTTGILALRTGASPTTAVTIDASQNVGVGTASPDALLTVNTIASFGAGAAGTPSIAAKGDLDTGAWFPAANTLALSTGGSERMRIDSSGNVGIGTSSPNGKVDIVSSSAGANTNTLFLTNSSGTAGTSTSLVFGVGSDPTNRQAVIRGINAGGNAINLAFLTSNADTPAERMRITSDGKVGIGTSSPTSILEVTGGAGNEFRVTRGTNNFVISLSNNIGGDVYVGTSVASALLLQTNNTERMRITSDGYTKMSNNGTYVSSTGPYHEAISNFDNSTLVVRNSNGTLTAGGILYIDTNRNTTNNTFYALSYYNNGAGAYKFIVADSGNVTNTNGTYGTISDIKNKENIVDATPKLEKVNQLKVRNFNFKGDDLKQIGFVAQEFEQVFPSMVEEHPDKDKEGNDLGTTTKSIKTSVLVPILVKAIQEQQAMIEELKQEVALLKSK